MRDYGLEQEVFVFDCLAPSTPPPDGATAEGTPAILPLLRHFLGWISRAIYRVCGDIGEMTLYRVQRLGRWTTRRERLLRYLFARWHVRFRRNMRFALERFCYPLEQFLKIFAYIRIVRSPRDRAERVPLRNVVWVVCKKLAYPVWRLVVTILNLAAPVAAVWLLALTMRQASSLRYGLEVEYNGVAIGTVQDEAEFDRAQRLMNERLRGTTPQAAQISLKLVPVDGGFSDVNRMVNEMIRSSGTELYEGYGLYVDSEFVGSLEDSGSLLDDLAARQDRARSGVAGESVSFNRALSVQGGLYPVTSKTTAENVDQRLNGQISSEKKYVVQTGDTPSEVAQLNGITTTELERLNPGVLESFYVGDELIIAHSVPYLRILLTRPETSNEAIAFPTEQETDAEQLIGYTKVAQEGENGVREITSMVTYLDDEVVDRLVVDREIVKEPVPKKIVIGGRKPERAEAKPNEATPAVDKSGDVLATSGSGEYIWPVDGGAITTPIWGYPNHTGNDITGIAAGTTIRAAASGVVIKAQQDAWGYGRHIIIQHPDGTQTLYAHNSANYIRAGDEVVQGQAIAAVGQTGNAYGNHCHFEIRYNGQYIDARKYIGYSSPR